MYPIRATMAVPLFSLVAVATFGMMIVGVASCSRIYIFEPVAFEPITENLRADVEVRRNRRGRILEHEEKRIEVEKGGLKVVALAAHAFEPLSASGRFTIVNDTTADIAILRNECALKATRVKRASELPQARLAEMRRDAADPHGEAFRYARGGFVLPAGQTGALVLEFDFDTGPWNGKDIMPYWLLVKRADLDLVLESKTGERFGYRFTYKSE